MVRRRPTTSSLASSVAEPAATNQSQRERDVLLDDKDREVPGRHDPSQQFGEVVDDCRGEPLGRLIEEEHLGFRDEHASDSEHLLLAARQGAALLTKPTAHPREVFHDVVGKGVGHPSAGPQVTQTQVLLDGELGEDVAPLGNVGDPGSGAAERRERFKGLPVEIDAATAAWQQPHQPSQQGCLATSVAAQYRDRLAVGDFEAHALQDRHRTVAAAQVTHFESHHASPR